MKKILIVEDELGYLKILNTELTKKGYKIFEAVNGEKGLQEAKAQAPDLILLDIRMPVMDGMTMLKELRLFERSKNIPKSNQARVIVLTNLEPDEKIISGVVDDIPLYYCIKSDTNLNDLFAKIEEVLMI